MTSRINDNTSSLKDASLSARVEKITEALEERKQLVEEGTQVLRGTADSLLGVRAKYEPVKSHASVLVSTSKNATSCIEEVSRLLACLKVYEKLEKALNRPTSDRNDAILSAMKEVSDANQYLIKLEHLPTAINALARNRQSLARAVSHCSSTYDRTMKTCSLVPNAATVENVLSSPPENRPQAVDMFFPGRQKDVQGMVHIMTAMVKADDHTCLSVYIKSRQKAVAAMLQAASTSGGGAVPAGAEQHRQIQEWSHQVRMLAQAMQWEMQLAKVMVPQSVHSKALEAILSTTAKNTIDTGYSLAGGRASPERLFPLLDGISCMHDPYVLPLMKLAFKEEALKHLKQKFHDLLGYQYEQAQHCVESFSASISGNIVLRKELGNIITVAQQTAFVMRVLKSLFRKDIFGKLPFMTNPQVFVADSISVLLKSLEQKIQAAVREPSAVAIGMLNNARYIMAGVSEHDHLPSLLGPQWKDVQKRKMAAWRHEYFQNSWQQLRDFIDAARAEARPDAKKDSVKEHCKRINARLERSISMQAEWSVPDGALKADIIDQVVSDVLIPYNQFWTAFSELQLLQNPQKHFKYSPQEVKEMVTSVLFSGAPAKPGLFKK